jgi:predicted transcriptional regulator
MNNLPDTSLAAYKAVSPEMLTNHHSKIIEALRLSKNGLMYEQIAAQVKLDKHQVGRRISELESMQIIYKPGEKRNTSTGRSAYVYKLVQNGEVSAQPEKAMKGESVSDISRKLIQKSLF